MALNLILKTPDNNFQVKPEFLVYLTYLKN